MTAQERVELDRLVASEAWLPLPCPQTEAFWSQADFLFYGGAAGGGKTDLSIGLALTAHERSVIYRREATNMNAIVDRIAEIVGGREWFNGQEKCWRLKGRQIDLGSCLHIGDEKKHQGKPHDLICFDEITHFAEIQFRFLCGWLRTKNKRIKPRVICTGNPPTDPEGEWVVSFWGPWLDPTHPNPAKPGELRWFVVMDGEDVEVDGPETFVFRGEEITPTSRTFIPSSVRDNPFYMETGYIATLQALPEPLRSKMLNGDFQAGKEDNPFQVCPTEWVEAAMARWSPDGKSGPMDSLGVDVARGGKDNTILSPRYGRWFDKLKIYPGSTTPDGPTVGSLAVAEVRDGAPIHIDVIGVGSSPYDHLNGIGAHVVPVVGSERAHGLDASGTMRFANRRSELYWRMREALDPANGHEIALPPDRDLKVELCSPRWKPVKGGIQVESKDEVKNRVGRSPDRADAVIYSNIDTPKRAAKMTIPKPVAIWDR